MENSETQVWLDISLACEYIDQDKFSELDKQCDEVSRLFNYMINHPDKFS